MRKEMANRIRIVLEHSKEQYALPVNFFLGIYLFLFTFIVGQFLLTFPRFSEYKLIFWGENKILENVQFLFFMLAGILSLRIAWLTVIQVEKPLIWIFYLSFSLGLFFIAMEEIAWGQQFLQFNTPESIKAFNVQNEFTLHNVAFLQNRTDFLNFLFGIGGVLGLWIGAKSEYRRISIPNILSIWFFAIFVLSALGVFNDFVSVNTQFDYSLHKQTETVELMIAVGACLYLLLNIRSFTFRHSRWRQISDVTIKEKMLTLYVDENKKISMPLIQIPWLAKASKKQINPWKISDDGKFVSWPGNNYEIHLNDILANIPTRKVRKRLKDRLLESEYLIIAMIAALLTTIWFMIIPSDAKNVQLLGYSFTRLSMITASLAIAFSFNRALQKLRKSSKWHFMFSRRLHALLAFRENWWISFNLALSGAIISIVFLAITFSQNDPYVRGILNRLSPWAFFSLVIFILISVYALRKMMHDSRMKLALGKNVMVDDNHISITFLDKRKIVLPLTLYSSINRASQAERRNFRWEIDALRLSWPTLGKEYSVQQFLSGVPDLEIEDFKNRKNMRS